MAKKNKIASEYAGFLSELKQRIRTTRLRATLSVNHEMVLLYWSIGRDILVRQAQQGWGAKVIDQLSADLRKEFPEMRGLSGRNLKYMRAFAAEWPDKLIVQEVLAQIPWYHNITLLEKLDSAETRLWYAQSTIEHGWSRNVLVLQMESELHQRRGAAQTNFTRTLPPVQSDLAQQSLKDPYCFEFLDLADDAQEKEVERALLLHIRDFLLEMGIGFAFIGSQVPLEIGGDDFYLDLLFYHTKLHCHVVVELKTGPFQAEFAGKLNLYLSAVDDIIASPEDTPTIGLLLCKGRNKVVAEYALRDVNKPIGVADWQKSRRLPDDLAARLPTLERLEEQLSSEVTTSEYKLSTGFGNRHRESIIRVGEEYVVEPLNPKKIRNRGRHCIVTKITVDYPHHSVNVKYLDNNRAGRPDPADLRPKRKSLLVSIK